MTQPTTSNQPHCPNTPAQWATYLHALADPVVGLLDLRTEFKQARAKPLMLIGPLLLRILQSGRIFGREQIHDLTEYTNLTTPPPIRENPKKYPDLYLWWALVDPALDPLQIIDLAGNASLVRQDLFTTIEVWTETELAALHALSHHLAADHHENQELPARLNRAVAWHIENTQPDNATNHPWAVQTFLDAGTPEAQHFAETLINNCRVQNARPDPFSAWILIDAATALNRESAGGSSCAFAERKSD